VGKLKRISRKIARVPAPRRTSITTPQVQLPQFIRSVSPRGIFRQPIPYEEDKKIVCYFCRNREAEKFTFERRDTNIIAQYDNNYETVWCVVEVTICVPASSLFSLK